MKTPTLTVKVVGKMRWAVFVNAQNSARQPQMINSCQNVWEIPFLRCCWYCWWCGSQHCCRTQKATSYLKARSFRRGTWVALKIWMCLCAVLSHLSHVQLFATPWTIDCQAPLSMGFPRQQYWSGLPCPPPGDLPDSGIEPVSLVSPALADGFFTTWDTHECAWKPANLRMESWSR